MYTIYHTFKSNERHNLEIYLFFIYTYSLLLYCKQKNNRLNPVSKVRGLQAKAFGQIRDAINNILEEKHFEDKEKEAVKFKQFMIPESQEGVIQEILSSYGFLPKEVDTKLTYIE